MSAQFAAPRPRRTSQIDTDDPVVSRALEFADWSRRNIRLIVAAGVVAAVVVGGLIYYRMYRADRLERAATEFIALEQTVASGNQALAVRDLGLYIDRFEGTMYGDEATLMLASVHLEAGAPQEAIAALQELAGRIDGSPLGAQAALLLGDAQQAAGDTEAAVATYLRVADEADASFRQEEALRTAALVLEEAGDTGRAAELYRRLIGMTEPGEAERAVYEMRLAEVEAAARG